MSGRRTFALSGPILFGTGGVLAYLSDNSSLRQYCTAVLAAGYPLTLPTVVYAQAERGANQRTNSPHYLAELLTRCEIATLSVEIAHQAGWLLHDSETTDVVDTVVVAEALARPSVSIVTSDWRDLPRLLDTTPDRIRRRVRILRV